MTRRPFIQAAGLFACLFLLVAAHAAAQPKRMEASRLQGLCVRVAPDSGSKIVKALWAGEKVAVLGQQGDWVEVEAANGARGFVYGGYLTGFNMDVPAMYASRLLPDISPVVASPAAPTPETPDPATPDPATPKPSAAMASAPAGVSSPMAPAESARAALDALALKSASGAKDGLAPALSGTQGRFRIEVYLNEHRLYLFEKLPDGGRRLVRDYEVATPGGGVAAPEGWGVVTGIDFNPGWTPTANMKRRARLKGRTLPDYVAPGLKSNPMGTFKIILSHGDGYRIHGNNNPRSIGKAVTSGCIRMRNDEGEAMARMIDVGSEVVFF